MNRQANPSSRRLFTSLGAAFALMVAACAPDQPPAEPPPAEPPLAGAAIGGDFELTSGAGQKVRWTDFAGKYRVLYFGYAYCPDICPNDMSQIARGLKKLTEIAPEKAANIQPIFITIDPTRDTQEVIAQFTSAFSDDFIGLTGTQEQIDAVTKSFAVYAAKGDDLGGGQYLMDHSNIVYLFGPKGEPLATLPVNEGPDAIAAEIDTWVN